MQSSRVCTLTKYSISALPFVHYAGYDFANGHADFWHLSLENRSRQHINNPTSDRLMPPFHVNALSALENNPNLKLRATGFSEYLLGKSSRSLTQEMIEHDLDADADENDAPGNRGSFLPATTELMPDNHTA